ncbi:MAG TPA: SpaA isopeptide-forming pilin-related protein, partial [Thermomicrobiales bacterium]|nr:SpaA isopeptide-forming pilin-related protein [Thermomicrobiales bacterium]
MVDRTYRAAGLARALRLSAALMLLLTGWLSAVAPVAAQSGSVDVAIFTKENGQPAYDACYVLVDFSDIGCDENADGKVMFADVPYGTYTVHQTADLGPGRYVDDFTIEVTGNRNSAGFESHSADIINTAGASSGSGSSVQTSDVAIWTKENGNTAYDACYVLVDFSDVGCDENADGKVTFMDVPVGTYTVHQTADLGPSRSVPDFTIQVTGAASSDGWEPFTATVDTTGGTAPTLSSASGPSGASGTKDISLITRDPANGRLLTGTCYVLVDFSNEGCDENGDGQVTFDDVPTGTYTVRQTQKPAGYPTANDLPITVDTTFPNVPVGYLVRQATAQNAPGTRNVSFLFVDSRTKAKIVPSPICLQIGNVSDVGCDEDLVDGQIDFLDVQSGTHELALSNLPSGWQIPGAGRSGPSVTIGSGSGPQIIYIEVQVPNGETNGRSSGQKRTSTSMDSGAIAVIGGSQTGTTSQGPSLPGTSSTGIAVELILDTSDSMNERDQGNQTRIEVAKTVTTRLVTETLPAGVPMALRTYSGCSSSLAMPMQPLDPDAAAATIAGLRASGQTPIEQSLRAAGADLANVSGPKIIVLVTDGEETCSGDPGAAIRALVAQDVSVQVNIVGFAIDDAKLTATFQEWARDGNGNYFAASNELELNQAVTTASQLSFHVIDQQGSVIADGTVGGNPVAVPAGTYTVEVDTVPITRYENVVVAVQQTTTIDLDASGTTSTSSSAGGSGTKPGMGSGTSSIGQTADLHIAATTCDGTSRSGSCVNEIGAQFTVTTEDGEFLGSCTIEGTPESRYWGIIISCAVPVPDGIRVVVTEDVNTITPGHMPEENPIVFDMADKPVPPNVPSYWGVIFHNGPSSGNNSTGSSNTSDSNSSAGATLLMTFRGCPEWFDHNTGDFFADCA